MLHVGQTLYGYCQGMFDRDSYEAKRIEAIGFDWVVCRDEDGVIHFASSRGESIATLLEVPENLTDPDAKFAPVEEETRLSEAQASVMIHIHHHRQPGSHKGRLLDGLIKEKFIERRGEGRARCYVVTQLGFDAFKKSFPGVFDVLAATRTNE